MGKTFGERLVHAWNAFSGQQSTFGTSSGSIDYGARPERPRSNFSSEQDLLSSIYTRLSIDVASTQIMHIRTDENGRYSEEMNSGLNNCLTVEANIDQSARHLRQDIAFQMFHNGVVAVAPVDTTENPKKPGSWDILTLRAGPVVEWAPQQVKARLYNDKTGTKEDVVVEKRNTAIIENPLYSVMNEPNSTLKRLTRKLSLLDFIDEQSSSGKLDIIIQLPYVVKSEARRAQAEKRRGEIETQLTGSKYGIAYTDGTEKITQLNRPAENNLLVQIESLKKELYSQLGMAEEIFLGTADEKTMLNYHNRTIEPIISAITDEFNRKFLTKTARTQRQTIRYFRDPFKLVSAAEWADIADKFTRNEILSPNDVRGLIGMKPSNDPKADELRNRNLNAADAEKAPEVPGQDTTNEEK